MQLYADDVRVFDAWGTWSYEGAPAWREVVENWFSAMADGQARVSFDAVRTFAEGGLTVVTAIAIYAHRHGEEAEQLMHNRMSWAIRNETGALKIVHEHTSVPVRYEDSTAILLRND
jgi:ketosteroid isomerase-like protein